MPTDAEFYRLWLGSSFLHRQYHTASRDSRVGLNFLTGTRPHKSVETNKMFEKNEKDFESRLNKIINVLHALNTTIGLVRFSNNFFTYSWQYFDYKLCRLSYGRHGKWPAFGGFPTSCCCSVTALTFCFPSWWSFENIWFSFGDLCDCDNHGLFYKSDYARALIQDQHWLV